MEDTHAHLIHYGFGKEYLKNWGIKEGLREIYQNYMDYGLYTVKKQFIKGNNIVTVTITNNYVPEKLEFLRIGMSNKNGNQNAIGKHGEGLKMAFLIFARLGLFIKMTTNKFIVYPTFIQDDNVGELFCLKYYDQSDNEESFITEFECDYDIWKEFSSNIINKNDIIFHDDYHGSIVKKTKGNIYIGGLYVCNLENLLTAYDFVPSRIPLDRDRAVPRSWDINYHSSKLQELYGHWNAIDTTYTDTQFISNIPDKVIKQVIPVTVGNSIEFITKDNKGQDVIISNDYVKQSLLVHSAFTNIIARLKQLLAKKLGLYDLLIAFQEKHVHTQEAKQDFAIILSKVSK